MLALLACVAGPEDTEGPVEPAVELGTGEWEWEDLGEVINVIRGPQGGYHLLGSLRARGRGTRRTWVTPTTRRPTSRSSSTART